MRKIIAIEELDTEPSEMVDVDLAQGESITADINEQSDSISEATAISDTMSNMVNLLETSDGPKEVSDETAEVVKLATEHFCNRLGYKRKSMTAALENYGTSKKKNNELLSELKIAQEAVAAQLVIAQEGLWARIKHRVSLFFTNDEAILKNLTISSFSFDNKGSREGYLEKPGFSKYLNPRNKTILKAREIVDEFSGLLAITNSAALSGIIKELTKSLKTILHAKVKTNHGDIVAIIKEHDKIKALLKDVSRKYSINKKGDNEADIEVISLIEKNKLVKTIESLLNDHTLENAIGDLWDMMDYAYDQEIVTRGNSTAVSYGRHRGDTSVTSTGKRETTVIPMSKADSRANDAYDTVEEILNVLWEITSIRQAWCHAGVAYIKASTAK